VAGKPTHNLVVQRRPLEENGKAGPYIQVGVGWLREESGHLSISLDDGIVLDWRMKETHFITLFKRRDR